MAKKTSRFNVRLDQAYADKLRRLASRTHVQPGTLARSLLSAALDEAELDTSTAEANLDELGRRWEGFRYLLGPSPGSGEYAGSHPPPGSRR